MSLTLSSQDVAAFVGLQRTLLSPLEYDSVDDWCRAVLRRSERLLQADRSSIWRPSNSASRRPNPARFGTRMTSPTRHSSDAGLVGKKSGASLK
jgi:hypothetical protein